MSKLLAVLFLMPPLTHMQIRDVPDIHPVPGKCRVSHYSVLPGPGKIMKLSNKKKFFFTRGINDPSGRQKLC